MIMIISRDDLILNTIWAVAAARNGSGPESDHNGETDTDPEFSVLDLL